MTVVEALRTLVNILFVSFLDRATDAQTLSTNKYFSTTMNKWLLIAALALLVTGCQQGLTSKVPDVQGELLYYDAIKERTPADQITVFGIKLGDSETDIKNIHGEPDTKTEYRFGRLKNLEYNLEAEETSVLYHLEEGRVTGILLNKNANNLLTGATTIEGDRAKYYSVLGEPTLIQDLHLQRLLIYDEQGYEIYFVSNQADRIYFTTPNQGRTGPGQVIDIECGGPVTAEYENECLEFPNECLVPTSWNIVEGCENQPPIVCINIQTSAVNPVTGTCTTYNNSCEVPRGHEKVNQCPDTTGICAQVITPATNPATRTCINFSTPCAVPEGWELGCR